MTELLRIRRGVGVIYLLSGAVHAAIMILASLYSLRRLPWFIPARLWSEMYYMHFIVFVVSGLGYLFLSFRKSRVFHYEALVDCVVGIGGFIVLMSVAAVLLVKQMVPPWFSLAPSLFLLSYGWGLARGRPMGFRAA